MKWFESFWESSCEEWFCLPKDAVHTSIAQMAWVTGSFQSTFCSHNHCNRILALTRVGANHPSMSEVLAMSKTSKHLVIFSRGGKLATVRRKWSIFVFHSNPRISYTPQDVRWYNIMWNWNPRGQEGCAVRADLLEFHFRSRNPAWEKSPCSWVCFLDKVGPS